MDDHDGVTRRGELRIYLGMAPGAGKTFAMLGEARRRLDRGTDVVVGLVETHGRAKTAALLDGPGGRPPPVRPERARRDGPRRGARPQTRGRARRRARPHQRARIPAPQALAGRGGPAGRGHRRDLHGERPAPRVAQRRRRADHRCAPTGDGARRGRPPRGTARAGRHHPRGAAAPARARQRLRRREGRRRARELLPAGQPHRAPGAGAAVGGRRGRRRRAALPHRAERAGGLGDP